METEPVLAGSADAETAHGKKFQDFSGANTLFLNNNSLHPQ